MWLVLLALVCSASALLGGEHVPVGSAPWFISFSEGYSNDPLCGGIIISPNLILTASQCYNRINQRAKYMYLNRYNKFNLFPGQLELKFDPIYYYRDFHPQFMVIKLERTLPLCDSDNFSGQVVWMEAVYYHPYRPFDNINCAVYGMGLNGDPNDHSLKRVKVQDWQYDKIGLGSGGRVCNGDLGAPVVCSVEGLPVLAGITVSHEDSVIELISDALKTTGWGAGGLGGGPGLDYYAMAVERCRKPVFQHAYPLNHPSRDELHNITRQIFSSTDGEYDRDLFLAAQRKCFPDRFTEE